MKNGCLKISSFANTKKLGSNFKQITEKNIRFTPNIKKPYLKILNGILLKWMLNILVLIKCAHKSGKIYPLIVNIYATFYKTNKNKDIKNKYYLDKKILKILLE